MASIDELKFDDKNFNKHTEFGMGLLENSLRELGAGRSILVDKDNNIIAGNGIVEAANNAGITKTRVIETDGTELVVVKRKDMRLDSEKGRKMAMADNATTEADLSWDFAGLADFFDEDELKRWGIEISKNLDINDSDFLQDTEITKDKTKKIKCPFCGEEFEV